MKTLKFKCTLLSDVILNQKAATEGPNKTLDFIPGSCFLGIAASKLYKEKGECKETIDLFHSGNVRFGDAHPSKNGVRGLKIPASMFYPKLKKVSEECYIHHAIPEKDLESDEFKKKQLKQCRSGFYTFTNMEAKEVKTETNFAIKSAYDKDKRRSKDEQMYGYESLQKGLVLYFEVEFGNDELVDEVKKSLIGEDKRVGRSRTAQYGLVKIEEYTYNEAVSSIQTEKYVTVYADGRLIFLDEYGLPTFRPTAKDLGLSDGEIVWEKSQIRTFQYSPWNYQRQCFDADRCGIEKGSVFVVETTQKTFESKYVGSYKNEGFGKVIYNPEFLKADLKGNAEYKVVEDKDNKNNQEKVDSSKAELSGSPLLNYLKKQSEIEIIESDVYQRVNEWVKVNKDKFKGDSFASQWGAIRSIAMQHNTLKDLQDELFLKTRTVKKVKKDGLKEEVLLPNAYLTHGIAADKWGERGRKKAFEDFINGFKVSDKEYAKLTDQNAQIAIINLAAEMAKKCKEGR